MADDFDDDVLLDSDEDVSTGSRAKKTKVSDFIPKPRILTSPASKLAFITNSSNDDGAPRLFKQGSAVSINKLDSAPGSDNPNNQREVLDTPTTHESRISAIKSNNPSMKIDIESAKGDHLTGSKVSMCIECILDTASPAYV